MLENFKKVQQFNRAFDMVPKEPANYPSGEIDELDRPQFNPFICIRPELFIDQPKLIKLRLDLIDEEIKELNHAVETNDFVETRDALADILYVAYGMADVLGINIDCYIKSNQDNNFTDDYMKKLYQYAEKLEYPTNFCYIKSAVDCSSGEFENKPDLAQILDNINKNYKDLEEYCNSITTATTIATTIATTEQFENIANYLKNIIIYTYAYAHLSGIDADADFAIVHDSNMSKLCDTEEDAIATVADYIEKYVAGTSPYDTPYYYALPELGKWIVKNKSTGKALKNIKYRKVVF